MNLNRKQIETKTKVELLANMLGIDPAWATAIAAVESSLGLHQKSKTYARGVFQMTSIAMKDLLWMMEEVDDDLTDILCGLLFLRLLFRRHGSIEEATLHYCDPHDRHFYLDRVKTYMKELEDEKD